ncbi:MAG: D-glycero-beta-D-manno-heptose-7-phosphate kinase [archaeon]
MQQKLVDIVKNFGGKKVLVLGDVMLDTYLMGNSTRISPEAPVLVVNVERKLYTPGGASNTAANVKSLGGSVYLVGVVGCDDNAKLLLSELDKKGIITDNLVTCRDKPTTSKVRLIAHKQQIVRFDEEDSSLLHPVYEQLVISRLERAALKCDVVVVSDYAKGAVTENVMKALFDIAYSRNIPVIVDPRPQNKRIYRGCELITPNVAEAKSMVPEHNDLSHLCYKLKEELGCNVLLTRGEQGMKLLTKHGLEHNFNAITTGVYDVTGAGDTVAAALALSLASGAPLEDAAQISNYAAGIVVRKLGSATTTRDELIKTIKGYKP